MNRQGQFDRLLDHALKTYSQVEPRPGLEHRVLAHLRTAPTPARFPWLRWAAVAAALVIAAALVTGFGVRTAPVTTTVPQTSKLRTEPSAANAAMMPHRPVRKKAAGLPPHAPLVALRREARPPNQPALSGPLTEQEKALLAFVKNDPKVAREVASAQNSPLQRDTIAHLEISPLAVESVEVTPLEK